MVKHDNFTLLLTSSCQAWQFHIATDILWSSMATAHCYWHLVVKQNNFTLLLTSSVQAWQFHTATDILWSSMAIAHCYCHLMVKYGNFTPLLTSSGQERQFHIATDIQWSRMAIAHCYWHLVDRNGNFTLLLTLLLKFQSWGLIFAICNMQYCCSSTFWQVKFADAVFTSVRYTPTFVKWSDQDEMWDEVPR